MSFRTQTIIGNNTYYTLKDIMPKDHLLKILFVAKTPATISVNTGHYFQGKQGRMFWNMLAKYSILNVPQGQFEDDYLLDNGYGLTDIVKVPRDYGNEPSDEEYINGLQRILNLIEKHKPKVIVFVYKRVLDNIIRLNFKGQLKTNYGFNVQLEKQFNSKVFVFPMPGTPCTKIESVTSMTELKTFLDKI